MSGPEPFVAYESRGKMLVGLLGSCAFVAVGLFCLTLRDVEAKFAGVLAVGFFGLCAGVFLVRVVRPRRVALTIDAMGFCDHRQAATVVPWEAVVEANVTTIERSRFIGVVFDRPDRVPRRRVAALNTALGFAPYNIGVGFLDRKPDEVIAAFFAHLEAAQLGGAG